MQYIHQLELKQATYILVHPGVRLGHNEFNHENKQTKTTRVGHTFSALTRALGWYYSTDSEVI